MTTEGHPTGSKRTAPDPCRAEQGTSPAAPDIGADGSTIRPEELNSLVTALAELRHAVISRQYPLELPSVAVAARTAEASIAQLDDYVIPRLLRLDAPLLVVVGGSTGVGKSTLVNSLVRTPVSPAGVLRPTTRAPVLVCHPDDNLLFADSRLLPGTPSGPGDDIRFATTPGLPRGLALLDAPDIDSVVDANRALAGRLLAAADLWLFVTTATRYADGVPWALLRAARDRGATTALVLNRVPAGTDAEIAADLTGMLVDHDLVDVPLLVTPEAPRDGQGLLDEDLVTPVLDWLSAVAGCPQTRAAIVRQTVGGAVDALEPAVEILATALDEQVEAAAVLKEAVTAGYESATTTIERGVLDATMLRGEVLARWAELARSRAVTRPLRGRIGRATDRAAAVLHRAGAEQRFTTALEAAIAALLRGAAIEAAERVGAAWQAEPAGAALLARSGGRLTAPGADLPGRVHRLIQDWQRTVLSMTNDTAATRDAGPKPLSGDAVRACATLVPAAVFDPDGTSTIAGWKVLAAVFGDEPTRSLVDDARADLFDRAGALLSEDASRYTAVLETLPVDNDAGDRLRALARVVTIARLRTGLPAARTAPARLPAPRTPLPAEQPARLPAARTAS